MGKNKLKKATPYFTRKNLIIISLSILFSGLLIFCGLCLTAATTKIFSKENPILLFSKAIGFKEIQINGPIGMIGLVLVALYIIVFTCALIYEIRYAKINKISLNHWKMCITYVSTFIACFALSYGVTLILLAFFKSKDIGLITQFIGQSLFITLLLYIVLGSFIAAIAMLVVNFILIDKPYRAFKKNPTDELEDDSNDSSYMSNDVTSSFDSLNASNANSVSAISANPGAPSLNGNAPAMVNGEISKVEALDDREKVFPGLYSIDLKYDGYPVDKIATDDLSLEDLVNKFQIYLAKREHLYFDIKILRFFISGLGASRLTILEGLSGTGKSSLPRYFAKFVNGKVTFLPVQSTWRDKSSILGYFNDFSKTYNETDFLLNLYEANYNLDQINIFVLDEMNISRVEYYFADFLSVLEYPSDQWKLRIIQLPYGFVPPARLDNGFINIPTNSYFIGTANKDDSTFSISDKVYDRANTIFFDKRNEYFEVNGDGDMIQLSNSKLQSLFSEALSVNNYKLNKNDLSKFNKISDFIYDNFDVTFGNRILNQMETIVPIYVATGGKKEEALDFILSRKIINKLDGRFEEYIKPSLKKLLDLMHEVYGVETLSLSEKAINSIIRKL